MAKTIVEQTLITATEIELFVDTMKFVSEHGLWDDAMAYLKEQGKNEMFVDAEALILFSNMLSRHKCWIPDNPVKIRFERHIRRLRDFLSNLG